ncbi:MAG: hypothetical protein K9W46_06520 [Candidatus Heimdallarchaeum endolithica]|uniref:Tetratricopeptide repeat protein n=1 Tax=Candidatus Heimdallarchaeum endolithica TaxID=2876572 RepID=A0A9Y1FQT9_9ARCH|nr:MAG: hypothetical protein K9W46_06520 [Candidatus Heimdallarchaeum endolithica]
MSEIQRKIDLLISEANAHYETKRYKDAAKTFAHLIDLTLKNNDPEEAIYFGYRVADCWKKEKNELNRAKTFKLISEIANSSTALVSESYAKRTKNLQEKAESLIIAGESYFASNKTKAKEKIKEAIVILETIEKKTTKLEKKEEILNEIVKAIRLTGNTRKLKSINTKLISLKKEIAEKALKEGGQTNLLTALREFEDIIQIYEENKIPKDSDIISKIKMIKQKVEDYDPFST